MLYHKKQFIKQNHVSFFVLFLIAPVTQKNKKPRSLEEQRIKSFFFFFFLNTKGSKAFIKKKNKKENEGKKNDQMVQNPNPIIELLRKIGF